MVSSLNADIAFESAEKFSGSVERRPVEKKVGPVFDASGGSSRLGHQRHGHLSVTDVEVEGTSPMPTQGLVEFEKLFDMPRRSG